MNITRTFDTFEYFDCAINAPETGDLDERASRCADKYHTNWTGTKSFEDAANLALHGWSEGLAQIEKITAQIDHVIGSKIERPSAVYDIVGSCVDVGRFITGEPDCMMSFQPDEVTAHGKIVRVVLNFAASCSVSPEVLMGRGAAICALLQGLQSAGMSVELELAMAVDDYSDEKYIQSITAKRSTDVLELDRVAFICAHPSMLRRMSFAVSEKEPMKVREQFGFIEGSGYGRPCEIPEGEGRGDIYLGRALLGEVQWNDVAACSKWVADTLKAQGVTMKEVA